MYVKVSFPEILTFELLLNMGCILFCVFTAIYEAQSQCMVTYVNKSLLQAKVK